VRIVAGLVAFSALVAALAASAACGDKKSGGLPPSSDWKAPPSSDAAVGAVPETADETLARCAARSFVDDAARDGNLPGDIVDDLAAVPAERAIVVLRALASASARLPRADQHAMLLGQATLMLVERGVTDTAPAALQRVAVLVDRPADSELRPEIAAAYAARAWGRLADADAVKRLSADAVAAPYLARGLAEGGHDQLAGDVLTGMLSLSKIDPIAGSQIAVADLIRGHVADARDIIQYASADLRAVYAFELAKAAVERKHPEAAALFAQAAAIIDRESAPPSVALGMAELAQALGDTKDAAARRAIARRNLTAPGGSARDAVGALYNLYLLAVDAGAADEAAAILADMQSLGAVPWQLALARGVGLARVGELQRAVEDVAALPAEQSPPRGVVHLEVLVRYMARPQRDPELERWLIAHICDGIE
jgi:hypothetical protein